VLVMIPYQQREHDIVIQPYCPCGQLSASCTAPASASSATSKPGELAIGLSTDIQSLAIIYATNMSATCAS
jgi:hypothetical protein